MESDKASRAERMRREGYRLANGVLDIASKWTEVGHDLLARQRPPGQAEVRGRPEISAVPHEGVNPGDTGSALPVFSAPAAEAVGLGVKTGTSERVMEMAVSAEEVATLRTYLSGNMDEYRRMQEQLDPVASRIGYSALIIAAFFEAVDRRCARPGGPGTEETWVTGSRGDPMLVVIAEPSASLATQIKGLLPHLRAVCGEDTTPVLCFDRGGWSPDLFADIIAARFGLLAYRKNQAGKDIPDLDDDAFAVMTWTGDDGRDRSYHLADGTIEVPVTSGTRKGEPLTLRQVTRRDKGRQVHILTTVSTSQLPAPGVVYRMTGRWREENWFRYGRAHFDLDSPDSYAITPDDPARMVPNPAKKTAAAAVKDARKTLADAGTARQRKLGELRSPAPGSQTLITNAMLARLDAPADAARRSLQSAQAQAKATPAKIPLREHNPNLVRLEAQAKLITHAIKMAAFNAETSLARALNGSYARAGDEPYAFIRKPCTPAATSSSATAPSPSGSGPLSAPRRTRALAALCAQLNTTATCYPRHQARPALRSRHPARHRHCINDLLCQESWGC